MHVSKYSIAFTGFTGCDLNRALDKVVQLLLLQGSHTTYLGVSDRFFTFTNRSITVLAL